MVSLNPSSVRVRAYKVGFGDCLLITIGYGGPLPDGRSERHLLVDFGTKAGADGGPKLSQVAKKIAEHCGGRLDVVVITHRHQDHVRGFGDRKARDVLDPLQPSLIIRPWTDTPAPSRGQPDDDLGAASHRFFELLDALGKHSRTVEQQFDLDRRVLAKRARELAELGVSNVEALAMLDSWVPVDRTRWVKAGDVVDVDDILPGVGIEVLGPPTLEQVPQMKSYASSSAEYWLGLAEDDAIEPELLDPSEAEVVGAKEIVAAPDGLGRASWLLDRLHDQAPRQVLEIVEGFEDVLNNTSVVLLLTVGRRRLLLSGDAQVENWSYTLDRAGGAQDAEAKALLSRLADVDLYKVGHHGSRNATPRRLFDLWSRERRRGHPLCSVLSTQAGLYGTTVEGKVPKPELVTALESLGPLHNTEGLAPGVWWFDVEASATAGSAEFQYEAGPPQG